MASSGLTKKIMVIDDDSDDRDLFAEALTEISADLICYGVENGQKAIDKLYSIDKPDIIFLDLNMPVMNGWDCLKRLKSEQPYRSIPVIIHTTSSDPADKRLARELGAMCFLTKPDDYQTLVRMLEIVVDKLNRQAVELICEAVYSYLHPN